MAAFESFTTKWVVSEERAGRCLAEKIDRYLTLYYFPERAFRFVRQRQRQMGAFTK